MASTVVSKRVRFIEVVLLVMSAMAAYAPLLLGMGISLIALMFCDSGPLAKCAEMGGGFLLIMVLLAIGPFLATFALTCPNAKIARFLSIYPYWMFVQTLASLYGAIKLQSIPATWRVTLAQVAAGYLAMVALIFVRSRWIKKAAKATPLLDE
jgi:hypothetical protein